MNRAPVKRARRNRATSAGDHGRTICPLCHRYPRFNAETLAAFEEADKIMADINAGKRKGLPVDQFLAEMATW